MRNLIIAQLMKIMTLIEIIFPFFHIINIVPLIKI